MMVLWSMLALLLLHLAHQKGLQLHLRLVPRMMLGSQSLYPLHRTAEWPSL